jgi:hypothetical protein
LSATARAAEPLLLLIVDVAKPRSSDITLLRPTNTAARYSVW